MNLPAHLDIPDEVLRIARRLEDAGFETWCVGGAVRDNLLGFPNKDFDLATAAPPQRVRELFKRTVPVGIEHGTVAVLDRHNQPHEVTTFRRDVKTDGRHAVVEFGVSLDDDLARRDFTINAIAYHPLRHAWRDLFDGQGDLDRKVVRAVGDPMRRFREDYLRILRALRFAARFGFEIDPETWKAARSSLEGLGFLSAERVRDEWFRGLGTARRPSELVQSWHRMGALEQLLPDLVGDSERGVESGELGVVDRFETRDPVLITCYLARDPGTTLARLKCSNAEVERGRRIAAHRDEWPQPDAAVAVRRWLAAVGPAADDLLAIAGAEGWGEPLAAAVRRIRGAGDALAIRDLAVTGEDLLAAGVPQGPMVGELLRELLDEVLEAPERNTRAYLLERVRATVHEARGNGRRVPNRRR